MLNARLQQQILQEIPRILSLLDKNPYSPTYGCLDRKFWQYKIIDFPSGMQQELVLALAYVFVTEFPGNEYHGNARIEQYLKGVLGFHARAIASDGSLDDYFPGERALGATAYVLAALVSAYTMLGWRPDAEARAALERSATFLIAHQEAGTLSNHHAIAVFALTALGDLLGEPRYRAAAKEKMAYLASLQHADGWFWEYEGCDLGYQTVTLEFLARAYTLGDMVPWDMLDRLLRFLRDFVHPDGSLGGEYGSRNTYNFYPGGCALLSETSDAAAELLWFFGHSLDAGAANHLEDDGVFGHMLSTYVTALCAPASRMLPPRLEAQPPWLHFHADAGLFRGGVGELRLYGNLGKGCCYKLFRKDCLLVSDTGYMGALASGKVFCQNTPGNAQAVRQEPLYLESSGLMHRYNSARLSTFLLLALRIYHLCFGRFAICSRWLRMAMQAMLIYKKKKVPVAWSRQIRISEAGVVIRDSVRGTGSETIASLHRTTDAVNLHVITSNSFQKANLLPWEQVPVRDNCYESEFFHAAQS